MRRICAEATYLLDLTSISPYLLERSLLSPQHFVEGGVRVSDASQRNLNMRVECRGGPSYHVKHGVGAEKAATVRHEASVYEALQASGMGAYLPAFFAYDSDNSALILELLVGAETLGERHTRAGRYSERLAAQMGQAVAMLHNHTRENSPQLYQTMGGSFYGGPPHWILSVHRPYLRELGMVSNANVHTIKILQGFAEFCALLDILRSDWVASNGMEQAEGHAITQAPIHCDIKWSNVLVTGSGHSARIRLVDWELARLGDPCWDVGSFFGEYLTFWLLSIPVTGQDPPDHYLDLARYPLEHMRGAMRAFWKAYTQHRGMSDPKVLDAYLLRSVRYAGARLLQTAYEQGQHSGLVTSNDIVLLQLAFNILLRPMEAATSLLGIPPASRRAGWWS